MDTNLDLDDRNGTRLDVAAAPITLRLPAGSAIFAVDGEAWITQERMRADIFLSPGQRFDVPTRLPLVINATRGPARLYVVRPGIARRHAERDLRAFARSRADELRAEAQARFASGVVRAFRDFAARVRAALAPLPRVRTH